MLLQIDKHDLSIFEIARKATGAPYPSQTPYLHGEIIFVIILGSHPLNETQIDDENKGVKTENNYGTIKIHTFFVVFLIFSWVLNALQRFSLEFCKGRIFKHTLQISLKPTKILLLRISSVLTSEVQYKERFLTTELCQRSQLSS